jgi:hypothetical protein
MIESIALVLILVAPALLLGWLTLVGLLVSALGATSDTGLDALRLLRPSTRPT